LPNSYQAADGLLTIGEDYDWWMVAAIVEHCLSDASRGRLARALGGEAVTPDFLPPSDPLASPHHRSTAFSAQLLLVRGAPLGGSIELKWVI
jgi:hypothetical protein